MENINEALARKVRDEATEMSDRELLEAVYCMLRENFLGQQYAADAAHLEKMGVILDRDAK